jgi:AraC-like DNA-binding protein
MNRVTVVLIEETPKVREIFSEILRSQPEANAILPAGGLDKYLQGRQIDFLLGTSKPQSISAFPRSHLSTHPAVLRAISYLQEHFSEKVTLQTLATYAHLSKFRLCHLFKQQTTKSAKTYLTFLRISRAKELLKQQTMSITEVGQTVGFNDPSHFAKAFLRLEGFSPSAYRTGLSHKASSWANPLESTGRDEKARIDKKKARTA